MEKNKGGRPLETGTRGEPVSSLADLGISKKQSSEWQKIALVPDIDIKNYIERQREEERATTKSDILTALEPERAHVGDPEQVLAVCAAQGTMLIWRMRGAPNTFLCAVSVCAVLRYADPGPARCHALNGGPSTPIQFAGLGAEPRIGAAFASGCCPVCGAVWGTNSGSSGGCSPTPDMKGSRIRFSVLCVSVCALGVGWL
jgi:hypothetical protein